MGYGNNTVDWGMQSAPIYQGNDLGKWKRALAEAQALAQEKHDDALGWKKRAVELQAGLDDWIPSAKSWERTALDLRAEFASHMLSEDDVLERYRAIMPQEKAKYYRETSSKRTWDK